MKTVADTNGNVWNVFRVYRQQPGFVEVHIGKECDECGIKMPTHTYEDWVSGYIRVKV
jgi:TPP-dependent pyruvate/acetoin dehydrogenase alpha subunit